MRGKDNEVLRGVWKITEAKIGKIRVAKTKRRRKEIRRE